MDGPEERQPADRRFDDARDCAEAIGQVLAARFRGVTLEPLPAAQLTLLDALGHRERSAIVLRAATKPSAWSDGTGRNGGRDRD